MLSDTTNIDVFVSEVTAQYPVVDISFNWGPTRGEENCTYHDTPQGVVRIKWRNPPTQAQLNDISPRLIEAVKPLAPSEIAKRKRRDLAAKIVAKSDPTFAIIMKTLEVIHAEIKTIKEGKARPSKTLAEWQSQILSEFVNGD